MAFLHMMNLKKALNKAIHNGKHILYHQFLDGLKLKKKEEIPAIPVPELFLRWITSVTCKGYTIVHTNKAVTIVEGNIFGASPVGQKISREEWLEKAESNPSLKHFIQFDCGDLVQKFDFNTFDTDKGNEKLLELSPLSMTEEQQKEALGNLQIECKTQ